MKKYSLIMMSLFLSVNFFGLSAFSWESINDASAKLKNSYDDLVTSNFLKDIYNRVKESKTPYGDPDDYYFYGIDNTKAQVNDVLKKSDNKDEISQAKDVQNNIKNFEKYFKEYDSLTNDSRVINAWRQDRKNYLNLIEKNKDNKFALLDEKLKQLEENDNQSYKRLLEDYNNDKELLKKSIREEFIESDNFDQKRYDLEKALSEHALAEANFLINKQNLQEKILHGAVIGDREEAIGHKSIRDFVKKQDNSERDMYQKEADIYSKASDYINDLYVNLKSQYDIDQLYNKEMNGYRKENSKDFSRDYTPNLINDTRLNYDIMQKKAELNKRGVRDLENSWLSNIKFYTTTAPSYGFKYYGNKTSSALGISPKFATSLKNAALYIPSSLYNLLPNLQYSTNNFSQDSQEKRLKDKEFAEQLSFINSLRDKTLKGLPLNEKELKLLYTIESQLKNSFELRRRAKNVLTQINQRKDKNKKADVENKKADVENKKADVENKKADVENKKDGVEKANFYKILPSIFSGKSDT